MEEIIKELENLKNKIEWGFTKSLGEEEEIGECVRWEDVRNIIEKYEKKS